MDQPTIGTLGRLPTSPTTASAVSTATAISAAAPMPAVVTACASALTSKILYPYTHKSIWINLD